MLNITSHSRLKDPSFPIINDKKEKQKKERKLKKKANPYFKKLGQTNVWHFRMKTDLLNDWSVVIVGSLFSFFDWLID